MIRQAHTYLVSAMSGATLIAIAIAVFVVLVSAQVFRDWPIAALGDGGDAGVSKAKPVADGSATGAHAAAATGLGRRVKAGKANTAASAPARRSDRRQLAIAGGRDSNGGSAGTGPTDQPGGGSGSTGGGGNAAPQSPSSSSSTASAGPTGSSSGSGGSGGSGGGQTGGGTGGGGSGGGGTGEEGSGGGSTSTPSTSGAVTETVNGTVNTVDEAALGGTLGSTGVTEVTEGVVNGVAGPESTVGKVVDETVNTVGKLLGR